MSTPEDRPFGSNTIPVFKFEPFSFRWTYPPLRDASSVTVTISSGIPAGTVTTTASNAIFASATGLNVPASSNESIVFRALDSSLGLVSTSSNVVSIGLGRFVSDISASLEGRSFTFFRNEPTIPTVFAAPFALNGLPLVAPTLPAGLSFVFNSTSQVRLSGTPLLQTPTSNYLIIGSNAGATRFITTRVTIGVLAERMILDLSGTGVVGLMTVGTAISNQVLTARAPPYPQTGGTIRYTFGSLPDGLTFTTNTGTPVSSGVLVSDASSTLILTGTPTVAAARVFATAGITQSNLTVTATRVAQPSLSNSQSFIFSFGETILFDPLPPSGFRFFTGVPSSSSNVLRAQTYFTPPDVNVPITSIVTSSLPSGLSLSALSPNGQVTITGTATTTGTTVTTFRASNANGRSRDVSASVLVVADSITFTSEPSAVDISGLRFVVSRPVSNALPGYYTAPLSWRAVAASGQDVSFAWGEATGGTVTAPPPFTPVNGLGLARSGNSVVIAGTPTRVRAPASSRLVAFTSSSLTTPPSAERLIPFQILADEYAFSTDPSSIPTFIQNKAVPSFRISATTLSERTVLTYSSSNLPLGLRLTNFGALTGTPRVSGTGTITVVASTGLSSGSNVYPYTILSDDILFFATPNPVVTTVTGSVSVQLSALSFANTPVTGYEIQSGNSYGLSVDASSGLVSGTLSPSLPLGTSLFSVSASAGLHIDTLPVTLTKTSSNVTVFFNTSPPGGPTISSPTVFDYLRYQYVPFDPIQIVAAGSGVIRYFLRTSDLPPGVALDQLTGRITGKTVSVGTQSFTVYAEDSTGVTPMTFTFTTVFPIIAREGVTPASAYTSLVRQYTNVNAARNAENNVVYPGESRGNGAFVRPTPPNEITQTVDPKCFGGENCT